jgi:hypothetical protein
MFPIGWKRLVAAGKDARIYPTKFWLHSELLGVLL